MEKSLYIWIEYINIYVLVNFGEDSSSIKEVMPIAHVPHPPRCAITICSINQDTPLPMCPIDHVLKKMSNCQKDVKLSKRCKVVKKM